MLYSILRLRSEVFVEEQACAFLDLDGRDTEAGAWHFWVQAGPEVVSYLRVLAEYRGSSIGRVVTRSGFRHRGLATRLVATALELAPRPVAINAQVRLVAWYAGFGFGRSGEDFMEDGILHTPMELE